MKKDKLVIRGAKTHNLKNISLDIPKKKLVVFTGVSGSGKSSLVFDTIYSEGQRRYVESLSSYARQFLGVMDKPDVDAIEGISPAIAIDQKSVSKNPRSTVGTITEIYDYLRLLFAHVGVPYCPNCNIKIESQSASQVAERVRELTGEVLILAPVVAARKGEHQGVLSEIAAGGYVRVRLDDTVMTLDEALGMELDPQKKHTIEVVVDRLTIGPDLDNTRLVDSIETALKIGRSVLMVLHRKKSTDKEFTERVFSEKLACHNCGFSMREVEPRTFSFNSPYGACSECSGLGTQMEVDPALVIPNKGLSLAEGAVVPWMTASHRVGRQGWYWLTLQRMGEKYSFSLNVPVRKLPSEAMDVVLYGDDEFEGVVPNLERRFKETESEWTRAEIEKYMNIKECPACEGRRLKPEALGVKISGKNIYEVSSLSIDDAIAFFAELGKQAQFTKSQKEIAKPILKEVALRLGFLHKVGLSYLTLARESGTLSGGEGQRIRLATQLGSYLSGVFYILDEPSIGLHARDQERLIETMRELRDLDNSVFVVEHDPLTIQQADWIIDIGPGAGKYGGKVLFEGTPAQLKRSNTATAQYLSGKRKIGDKPHEEKFTAKKEKGAVQQFVTIKGATEHNLKNIDVKIPLGKFVAISGVSGSGKSSLVNDILAKYFLREFHGAHTIPGAHKAIIGTRHLNKAIVIDQSPIGRTPRSNPATYTGVFSSIRELFAATQEAKARGYTAGRFSFNVKGGRCEACRGGGVQKVEMFFLPDLYVECDVCGGRRYNKEALEITYRDKSIADVLEITVDDAYEFFKKIPQIEAKLGVLKRVGLGYVELGQPAPSLSGGEAQRVKLATELSRRDTGKTFYILDEPTTGLHFEDVNNLLAVLRGLVAKGNTVLVIEHNMDIIANADWVIDLGPEGGDKGGEIVAEGTPAQVAKVKKSYTGQYLKNSEESRRS
ncbi:MAG: excinuclease ABC subunit UvrA [Candidatus Spechtbacterales bacterium]